ncbi:MAG TPA: hypothetical protein VM260_18115, partial [Pirellula sp.]|nr:hypothetical protein [Pirellula sp.]
QVQILSSPLRSPETVALMRFTGVFSFFAIPSDAWLVLTRMARISAKLAGGISRLGKIPV